MKFIRPVTLTDGASAPRLISSTVAEPSGADPSAYAAGTTYAADMQVYRSSTHRIYKSKQAANVGHTPETSRDWWAEVSGTNKWAMFDNVVASATSGASPMTVEFEPGIIDALVLIGLIGNTADVTITDGAGGPTIYSRTLDLQTPIIADLYAYFFEPFRQVPLFVLTDLPPYLNARVTVTITGDADVACGMCIPGRSYTVGETELGVQSGIRDYSRKKTDPDTGLVELEQGKFAKTLTASVQARRELFSEISQALEGVRAVPCVWVADDDGSTTPLTVFGFYRDFRLVASHPKTGVYSLDIEGMV